VMMMEDEKLLITEYVRFQEAFWKNEELGERRVNFFITLTTAIIAGIVALMTSETELSETEVRQIASAALSSTFLFGVITFLRMLKRNRVTDEYKGLMRYLREQLSKLSPNLHEYELPFQPQQKRLLGGGLAETVAVINSVILAVIAGLWLDTGWGWMEAVGTFLVTFVIQSLIAKQGSRGEKSRSQSFRAGVGAVIIDHEGRVLAMERSDIAGAWQLPQGGLEIGEDPLAAAYREIREETGIDNSQLHLLSTQPRLLAYELPIEHRSKKTGRGQTQYWFRFRFESSDDAITLGDKEEFTNWAWMTMDELLSSVADFRVPVYLELAKEHLGQIQDSI
jgi:putative (di)nucleoside polyphosphate hydrolase